MKPKTIAFIKVQYRFVEGHHMFRSDDIDGLLVVSKNAETAYRDIAPSIKKLLKMNQGIECDVEPAMSFKEFLEHSDRQEVEHEESPLVLSDKEYYLIPA